MRGISASATAAVAILAGGSLTAQRKPYRGVNDTYAAPQFTSRASWNIRAAHLTELPRRVGRPPADAGTHAVERQCVWRRHARRLHRLEGGTSRACRDSS